MILLAAIDMNVVKDTPPTTGQGPLMWISLLVCSVAVAVIFNVLNKIRGVMTGCSFNTGQIVYHMYHKRVYIVVGKSTEGMLHLVDISSRDRLTDVPCNVQLIPGYNEKIYIQGIPYIITSQGVETTEMRMDHSDKRISFPTADIKPYMRNCPLDDETTSYYDRSSGSFVDSGDESCGSPEDYYSSTDSLSGTSISEYSDDDDSLSLCDIPLHH